MGDLRHLTYDEINKITSDVRYQKTDIKNILRSKGKVYKLSQGDISKIKKKITEMSSRSNLPRYLKEEEISYLVDDLPEIPSCIAEIQKFNKKQIIESLKFDLRTFKICPSKENLETIRKKILESYLRSSCRSGDSVGSNGAMALGATMTQTALDAFHTSGTENSQEEEERLLKDLMTPSSKKTSGSCNVHYMDKNLTREEILRTHEKKMQGISFRDLIITTDILDDVPEESLEWYDNYMLIFGKKVDTSNKFMRVKLNTYKCYVHGISLSEISSVLEKTTRSQTGKNIIYCVYSSNFEGIIDIHVDTEFISSSVQEFVEKGKTFKTCEKRFRGKTIETDEGKKRTYLKTVFDIDSKMDDLIYIFLNVILKEECFGDILLKGIKGVERISIVDHSLSLYMKFKKVWSDKEVGKYMSKDFNVKPSEIYRLYYCYVEYHSINILGIPSDKFIKFTESCGMKLVDNQLSSELRPYFVVILPEVPDMKIKEDDDGANKEMIGEFRFEKVGDDVYDRLTKKIAITPEEPMALLSRKLEDSKEELKNSIANSDKEMEITDFPPVYRYGTYCYLRVYGKNILSHLLRDRSIDPYFTCSNNVNDVMDYYGIESARLFFIKGYQSVSDIEKMNPVNIELLVDFQTSMGQILSVTSTDIAKHGKNSLVSASFEQPLEAFRKSSSIGSTDIINNVPSCLMTGRQCTNGTGASVIEFDTDYLKDENNKFAKSKLKDIKISAIKRDEILGNCFGSGNYVKDDDDSDKEENEALVATEEYTPVSLFKDSSAGPNIDVETSDMGIEFDDSLFDV